MVIAEHRELSRATQAGSCRRLTWRWPGWGLGLVLGAALGCGAVPYSIRVVQASNALTRAEQLGAAARAPYEYHYALEHLRKAREQAARSEYGNAEELADTAYSYASRAVQLAQRVEPVPPQGRP